MNDYKVVNDASYESWASFLDSFGVANLQQSFEYGEVAKETDSHTRLFRLLAMNDNDLVGLVQATYQKRFGLGERLIVGGSYGNGPVVANMSNKRFVLQALLDTLEKYGVDNRVPEALIHWPEHWGMHEVFKNMNYGCIGKFNVFKVNLRKSVDQLWKSITHNKRRNIKKAEAQGVEVFQGESYGDLVSFYEMLEISGKRAVFTPPPFNRFKAFLKVLGSKGKVRMFFADWKGQHVAGVFTVVHADTVYALGAGSREETWSVRPNDILHWKAMESASNEGLSYYHMGRVSDPLPNEDSCMRGLWRWKREWSGELEKTFIYTKVYMPKTRKFLITPYEKVYNLMKKIGF